MIATPPPPLYIGSFQEGAILWINPVNLIVNYAARGNPLVLWAIVFFSLRLLVTLIAAILTCKMTWKTSIDLSIAFLKKI